MIRRSLILLALLAALLLAAVPALAADPGDGTIQGAVANGTTGVLPAEPLTVTLNAYLNGDAGNTLTTRTAGDGSFSFTGLDTGTGYTYEVDVLYNGVTFPSDTLSFAEGQTSLTTTVSIYESTDDITVINVVMSHVVVYTDGAGLTVREVYYLENDSDRAYDTALTFPLPPDATPADMTTSLVWTTSNGANVVVDTVPVPPGQRQVSFAYTLPAASSYTLSRHLPLPMDQFNLLVQGSIYDISSPQLARGDPLDISGTSFEYYSSDFLAAGTPLEIVLTPASTGTNRVAVWLAVIGIVVVIGAAIYYFRSRGGRAAPASTGPAEEAEVSVRWEELLDELAALDDRLEAGTITEEEYRTVRDRTKAELKDLMGRENDGGDE